MFVMRRTSPVGGLWLASDGDALTGLWMAEGRLLPGDLTGTYAPDHPVFRAAEAWLDAYFDRAPLPPMPPLAPSGTPFQRRVWDRLREIPYGETVTYGALARGLRSSSRAVGGAVGKNPISILIPCHRVVGARGRLTGYAGGLEAKRYLLELEGAARRVRRRKSLLLPRAGSDRRETPPDPSPGTRWPCPCCGCLTFPVPPRDALAYICPVCMWENDLFTASDQDPSDENRGLSLAQARENWRVHRVSRPELARYVRDPLPEELP